MNTINIWLDDVRPMPVGYDLHVRTYWEFAQAIKENSRIGAISFDHDIASCMTGYHCILLVEEAIANGRMDAPATMKCHSQNPVGRAAINSAIQSCYLLMEKRNEQ
jgi:hypothetical protein